MQQVKCNVEIIQLDQNATQKEYNRKNGSK